MASEKLIEATKHLDDMNAAWELINGAKKELARISADKAKVLAVKAGALALAVEHGKRTKESLLNEMLSLANEMKTEGY